MKKILQILLVFLLSAPLNALALDNYLDTDTSLKFGGTKYTLGWSLTSGGHAIYTRIFS